MFAQRKKIQNILHLHSQTKYVFKHFYFICFISRQFADFASLEMQMQIEFMRSFNVLNNTT